MTVCIAAIYGGQCVVGASDRLLTAGDMQFQPSTPKILPLSASIAAMSAGDAWLQAEILSAVHGQIAQIIKADPEQWVTVETASRLYCDQWARVKQQRAESAILKPLGLTSERIITEQSAFHKDFVQELYNSILSFQMPSTSCIISGVDTTGPHIYVIHDGRAHLADTIGFAAIGAGARHAESQLMLARYGPGSSEAAALALVHLAKNRAEVAPGVGDATDMFIIGPQLGSYFPIPDTLKSHLRSQALRIRQSEERSVSEAEDELRNLLADMTKHPDGAEGSGTQAGSR